MIGNPHETWKMFSFSYQHSLWESEGKTQTFQHVFIFTGKPIYYAVKCKSYIKSVNEKLPFSLKPCMTVGECQSAVLC